ncbi:MAG: hypothetical protein AAB795_04070 [Patescibacteria group bacterium]
MEPTPEFCNEIRNVWGNPYRVADVAFGELFDHSDDICLDYDDQVRYAKKIGVLAGLMKDGSPEGFVKAFTSQVLNDE